MAAVSPFLSGHNQMSPATLLLLMTSVTWAAPLHSALTAPPTSSRATLGEAPSSHQMTDSPIKTYETSTMASDAPIAGSGAPSSRTDFPVGSDDTLADDVSEDEVSNVNQASFGKDLKKCVGAMAYTIVQTNDAFSQLMNCPSCQMAEFCSSQGTRMTECRNVINQTALTLPGLPSMDDAVDIYPKKTLFTNLMAVYNTTFQYTVAVDRMAESELANVCGTDSTCGADCSDPLDVPGELVPYCTLRGVYLAFDDLLNEQLKPVLTSLHGPVPEPQAIIPNSDTTSGNQWPCFTDLLLLAAANRQMMEAKTVMTTSVLTQL